VEAYRGLKEAANAVATDRHILQNRRCDEKFFQELEKYSDTPTTIVFVNDNEAEILAREIRDALVFCARWKHVQPPIDISTAGIPSEEIEKGVQIRFVEKYSNMAGFPKQVPPIVVGILEGQLKPDSGSPYLGVRWRMEPVINGQPTGILRYFRVPDNGLLITVGRNPAEQLFRELPIFPPTAKPDNNKGTQPN